MDLKYIISKRTNGANPFRIFETLESFDQTELYNAINSLSYEKFLESSYWFAVSQKAKSNAGMRCQVCNSPNKIQVHHRTYQTHGREHKFMLDLTVLCDGCHGLFHGHQDDSYVPPMIEERKRKRRRPIGSIVPHVVTEVEMPDGETFPLTCDLIAKCRTELGGITNATISALEVPIPLRKGWPERLAGKMISRDAYRRAVEGRYHYGSGRLKPTTNQ